MCGSEGRLISEVLTPTQERFLAGFFRTSDQSEKFYLSGGTALAAYYLRHRRSDDLDFFTRSTEPLRFTDNRVREAARAAGLEVADIFRVEHYVRYRLEGDVQAKHNLQKVELVHDSPPYFAEPERRDAVLVDALLNIGVNKVAATARQEPRDYVDLYMIVTAGGLKLEDLVRLAGEKDPGLAPEVVAAQFADVELLPDLGEFQADYMITPIDQAELIRFFTDWARRLFGL